MVVLLMTAVSGNCESEDWYFVLGNGVINIMDGIRPSSSERRIMKNTRLTSSRSADSKSTYRSLGIGHCLSKHVCLEAAYLWGAQFRTSITVSNLNLDGLNVKGIPVSLGNLHLNTTVEQIADVSLTQLSILGKYSLTESVDTFGRVGFYQYKINETARIPLHGDISLSEESVETGSIPTMSIGFDFKPIKKVNVRLEGQKIGPVMMYSGAIVYKFE